MHGLCEGVDRLTRESTGPTAFLTTWIEHRVRECVEAELPCSAAEAKQRKRKKRDACGAIPDDFAGVVDSVVDPTSMTDLQDSIDSVCKSRFDRDLIAAFAKGHSVNDVAVSLNAPPHSVRKRREELYQRFLDT